MAAAMAGTTTAAARACSGSAAGRHPRRLAAAACVCVPHRWLSYSRRIRSKARAARVVRCDGNGTAPPVGLPPLQSDDGQPVWYSAEPRVDAAVAAYAAGTDAAVASAAMQESAAHAAQLVAAMDVTLQELQAREAAAAAQRLYKAAEGLNAAAIDLAALRVEYNSLVAREQAAVTARDYERATQIKSAQVQALKTYDSIRSFDFNLHEYAGVGAVATAFGGASGVGLVPVKVHIVQPLSFGEKMGIVGNLPELGAWDPEKAPLLQWTEGDLWVVHLSLPAGSTFEFKFFLAKPEDDPDGPFYWQEGPNRQFNLPTETAFKVDIAGSWAVEPEKELVWVCYPVTHDPNYVPPPTADD